MAYCCTYSRCIAGALNGNIGVMKSVIADITDHTNLAQAFVLVPPVFSVGASIAYVGPFACPFQRSDLDVQAALWWCFGKTTRPLASTLFRNILAEIPVLPPMSRVCLVHCHCFPDSCPLPEGGKEVSFPPRV